MYLCCEAKLGINIDWPLPFKMLQLFLVLVLPVFPNSLDLSGQDGPESSSGLLMSPFPPWPISSWSSPCSTRMASSNFPFITSWTVLLSSFLGPPPNSLHPSSSFQVFWANICRLQTHCGGHTDCHHHCHGNPIDFFLDTLAPTHVCLLVRRWYFRISNLSASLVALHEKIEVIRSWRGWVYNFKKSLTVLEFCKNNKVLWLA